MLLKAFYFKYTLNFKFDAGTSRGVLREKDSWFLKILDEESGLFGIGECSPLQGLSVDFGSELEEKLRQLCGKIETLTWPLSVSAIDEITTESERTLFPSVVFALETALLDLMNGGVRKIYGNDFFSGGMQLPINGLIWMGDREFMLNQINEKLESGFQCLKLKIGTLDFETECELLSFIRSRFSPDEVTLRVDANGAFSYTEAMKKLERLSRYQIHSIEQPIKQGQYEEMKIICAQSPIPVALDEELIGIYKYGQKKELLNFIKPAYIILKPTLTGGLKSAVEWIGLAEELQTGWWLTSALESNVGLNAISQFTAQYQVNIPQGLGTGKLYTNNINSPLEISGPLLRYNPSHNWDLSNLQFSI